MNKKRVIIAPILTTVISMLIMGTGIFLLNPKNPGSNSKEIKNNIKQLDENISSLKEELTVLNNRLKNIDPKSEGDELEKTFNEIKILQDRITLWEEEKNSLMPQLNSINRYRKKIMALILVIITVSLFIGLFVFLILKFEVFKNQTLGKVIYLIGFWISLIITLILLGSRKEIQAISFAILSSGFLISHNLSRKPEKQTKEKTN